MFCRNQTTRATVARGSALEMEIRRGKFRMSIFMDSSQDSDIQKKIDHEIRMREGTCKLLGACSQKDQALEASKSLLTCNTRILAYMSELQRMKEAQILQRATRRPSDSAPLDERLPCKGKVAISDLRIPLMWKDTEYFKNKGELHRCAVFCILQLGGEIHDTDMVMVDRTMTDICFDSTIIFQEACPGFELRMELYSCCSEDESSTGSASRKLASKLGSSLSRSSGKKFRSGLEPGGGSPVSNGGGAPLLLPAPSNSGPKYHLLAHTSLVMAHVQDAFRTHDLSITGNEECSYWLPLYGSACCRLVAQPRCMTEQMMSGRLKVKHLGGDSQSCKTTYSVLRGTKLFCYLQEDNVEAEVEPAFTIAINKETRIRATDKDPHGKAQSICISNRYGGEEVTHVLSAERREDTQRWMEAFWQHFYDMSQWKQCCDDLMKINVPLPRKPTAVMTKQGSLYHEMIIDTSDDIGTVTDILARRVKEESFLSHPEGPLHWMSLFGESPPPSHSLQGAGLSPHLYCRSPRDPGRHQRGQLSDSPGSPLFPRSRPRTLSLDAKLSSLRGRGYGSSPAQAPQPIPSCSSSTSSHSSSEGSTASETDSVPFPRSTTARSSLRNLRAKLDPRNWLQSQV
ncbi:rhotekin isoform X1 [Paramormyrops kingsleyae]|uniref:Rhotekin a n=2 Tax=Paramormyrops kingsleyae TaxID=1676925 RepID=A0A3B3RHA0_9TELE|nr:rhotekin isoform X1 [Paramormyrops kingsleyae]